MDQLKPKGLWPGRVVKRKVIRKIKSALLRGVEQGQAYDAQNTEKQKEWLKSIREQAKFEMWTWCSQVVMRVKNDTLDLATLGAYLYLTSDVFLVGPESCAFDCLCSVLTLPIFSSKQSGPKREAGSHIVGSLALLAFGSTPAGFMMRVVPVGVVKLYNLIEDLDKDGKDNGLVQERSLSSDIWVVLVSSIQRTVGILVDIPKVPFIMVQDYVWEPIYSARCTKTALGWCQHAIVIPFRWLRDSVWTPIYSGRFVKTVFGSYGYIVLWPFRAFRDYLWDPLTGQTLLKSVHSMQSRQAARTKSNKTHRSRKTN